MTLLSMNQVAQAAQFLGLEPAQLDAMPPLLLERIAEKAAQADADREHWVELGRNRDSTISGLQDQLCDASTELARTQQAAAKVSTLSDDLARANAANEQTRNMLAALKSEKSKLQTQLEITQEEKRGILESF